MIDPVDREFVTIDPPDRGVAYLPSLHQIWEVETKAIQATWTPEEERSRRKWTWGAAPMTLDRLHRITGGD